MLKYIGIIKSKYLRAIFVQFFCSCLIVLLLIGMRISIQFNDKSAFSAIKVKNVVLECMLAAEFKAVQLTVAQTSPQLLFSRRRLTARDTCSIEQFCADAMISICHRTACPSP